MPIVLALKRHSQESHHFMTTGLHEIILSEGKTKTIKVIVSKVNCVAKNACLFMCNVTF